jgi:hypothetical protein
MKFQKDAQEIQADHNETEVVSQEDAEQQVEPIVPQPVAQPVAQPTTQAVSPLALISQAISLNANIDVMEKVFQLHQQIQADEAKKVFFAAMSNAQAIMQVVQKSNTAAFNTKNGGRMSYKFASLDDVTKVVRSILPDSGLSYRYQVKQESSSVTIKCIVSHAGGHSEECLMSMPVDTSGQKNPLQAIASTVSYLKRYTLCASFGIATGEDEDDGAGYSNVAHQIGYQSNQPAMTDTAAIKAKVVSALHRQNQTDPEYENRMLGFVSQKSGRDVNSLDELTESELKVVHSALVSKGVIR